MQGRWLGWHLRMGGGDKKIKRKLSKRPVLVLPLKSKITARSSICSCNVDLLVLLRQLQHLPHLLRVFTGRGSCHVALLVVHIASAWGGFWGVSPISLPLLSSPAMWGTSAAGAVAIISACPPSPPRREAALQESPSPSPSCLAHTVGATGAT